MTASYLLLSLINSFLLFSPKSFIEYLHVSVLQIDINGETHMRKKIVPVIPKVNTLFFYLKIQLYESELRKCDREIICCWITQRWLQRSPLGPHQRQAFLLAHSLGCSGQNKWAIFCFPRPLLGGCFKNGAVGT